MLSDTVCNVLHLLSGEWREELVIGERSRIELVNGNLLPLTGLRQPFGLGDK
jgi:hypothetical protein